MGRFYSGDIEGKFWFGVQSSDDASAFGGDEIYIDSYGEEVDEDDEDMSEIAYSFRKEHLDEISETLQDCKLELGENYEKIRDFFRDRDSYTEEMLSEYLGIEDKMETHNLLKIYARVILGEKIKDCIKKKGECNFTAEL